MKVEDQQRRGEELREARDRRERRVKYSDRRQTRLVEGRACSLKFDVHLFNLSIMSVDQINPGQAVYAQDEVGLIFEDFVLTAERPAVYHCSVRIHFDRADLVNKGRRSERMDSRL